MRLSISNIAWDVNEDLSVAQLLKKYEFDAIDIAPGKYFPNPLKATNKEITFVKQWWADYGIDIIGMQSLLFGTTGLNVFGGRESQLAMLDHLREVCRIGKGLGATRLVFGSPKNRDKLKLSDFQALDVATKFFIEVGDIANDHGVIVCLEPNPTRYGANFMTNSTETAMVVEAIDHPSIKMQLDTGSLVINNEISSTILENSTSLIGHIHASEPDLIPLGDGGTDHVGIHEQLLKFLPQLIVTIEMLSTKDEPHLRSVERAIEYAINCYRSKESKTT